MMTGQAPKEDWEDSIEVISDSWYRSVEGPGSDRVQGYGLMVLKRMPKDARKEFYERCAITVWQPPGCSCTFPLYLPRADETEPDEGEIPKQPALHVVVLQADLPELPNDEAIAVIAHEFAHVVCDHRPGKSSASDGLKELEERELEADRLASSWGFGSEIRSLRSGDAGGG